MTHQNVESCIHNYALLQDGDSFSFAFLSSVKKKNEILHILDSKVSFFDSKILLKV